MPLWNNNDREESKPTWLTTSQKRWCVRTNAGWELPNGNSIANVAGQFEGTRALNTTGNTPTMELLVCLPNDPSSTGTTSSVFANRFGITGGFTGGLPAGAPNYAPYITTPFNGDGATAGGNNGAGLSHDYSTNYGLNGYGVSTLWWGVTGAGVTSSIPAGTSVTGGVLPAGFTGYIKVKANDVNFTDTLTISLTAAFNNVAPSTGAVINYGGPTGATATRPITFVTNSNLLNTSGPTGIPGYVYEAFFGPTSSYNRDIGIIILPAGLTTGVYGLTAHVNDGTTGTSATGSAFFKITVR